MDEQIQVEMYHYTVARLAEAGFAQYEISNWARPDELCEHNIAYWQNKDWLPLGPAAAGHVQGARWRNLPRLDAWLEAGPFSPIVDVELPDPRRRASERLMFGFPLMSGFSETELAQILEADPPRHEARMKVINAAIDEGLIEKSGGRVRFTASGVLLADGFLSDLL